MAGSHGTTKKVTLLVHQMQESNMGNVIICTSDDVQNYRLER